MGLIMVERIKIKIDLIAEFWDKFPMIDIILDDRMISQHIIDKKLYTIENIVELDLDQDHILQIRRYNKSDDQCVTINDEKKDQYVILDRLSIDDIDVQNLIWNRSWYEPVYPEIWKKEQESEGLSLEDRVIGEIWWSHNGMWNFKFYSPFYKFVISQFR